MPTMAFIVPATTADALATQKFRTIPPGGAVVNLFATCITVTDTFGFSTTQKELVVDGSRMNIETGAVDVVSTERDQLVFNEPVGAGVDLFLPVTVTTAAQFIIVITPNVPQL